jgi:alkanesulfonate monooxygenase SsuD/methylene tetrahydromethanopterin reductase-like flavin-dependent oxidoreductase (luciferase family)
LLLATDRIRVGSAAINVFTRGAGLVAVTWATLAEAAPGRVVLGLGVGSGVPLAQQGYTVIHSVERLEEFVESVRAAWTSDVPISRGGTYVRFQELMLEVRPPSAPPVYLCVGGPRALTLAGQIADGVVLDAFLQPAFAHHARGLLDTGSGEQTFRGELAGAVVVSLAPSLEEAAAALRPLLAGYLVNFPELARISGVDPELVVRLSSSAAADGMAAASRLIPDELVAAHALCGPPSACRERLAEYRSAGYELPILFPLQDCLSECITELAGA